MSALATTWGHTSAQLALAWLLAQGPDIVPIPGTRRISRLDENAAAVRIQLSAAQLQALAEVLAAHPVSGSRYPEAAMGGLGV